jgi:hypothetical protein
MAIRIRKREKGSAFITTFVLLSLLAVGAAAYVDRSTEALRLTRRQMYDVSSSHLCEAGVQAALRDLWRPFKINQNFSNFDEQTTGASIASPKATVGGSIDGVGNYSAGVISVSTPAGDSYTRVCIIRCVGWFDLNKNNVLDAGEPQKIVDVSSTFQLARSQVFDYTYFVNNYGWMDGFGQNDLIVNGDMRANGNFSFTNGSPTVNGSVWASANDKLTPASPGLINTPPIKMDNPTYQNVQKNDPRMRQSYSSGTMGAVGSLSWENWRDFVFDSTGQIVDNKLYGSVLGDTGGTKAWQKTGSANATTSMLDPSASEEVIMPDLSDLGYYQNLSNNYVDTKQTYGDGTTNPNYNKGAYVQVWNTTTSSYQTLGTNGVITGSASLIGTSSHPILIHGPVTFTQDAVIKGYVSGQGTIYTGRNVHIVGSIKYSTPPDFRGTSQSTIDNANEKADMLALAARGSVMMGDTSQFTDSYPLQYMTPPFTKGRYDDSGNWIPPFDAKATDSTGNKRYQSVMGDSYIHSISESVNQIDAILYTNFVGGGDIGTGGGGVNFNGSIISKDEAMVVFSLPMHMNYDTRIRERSLTQTPLIDLQLPRSPVMLRSTWQDRGFHFGGSSN